MKAGEVRKRLSLYYANVGTHDSVRIDLPGGTYVPEFRHVDQSHETAVAITPAETSVSVRSPVPLPPRFKSRQSRRLWSLILVFIVAAASLGAYFWY